MSHNSNIIQFNNLNSQYNPNPDHMGKIFTEDFRTHHKKEWQNKRYGLKVPRHDKYQY